MRKLEGLKKLGGDTARTADPNWPTGYSIPWDVPSSIGTGEWGQGIAARGLSGCRSAGGEQLPCASYVHSNPFIITIVILLALSLSLLVSSFFCSIKQFLSQPTSIPSFPDFLPHPTGWGGVSERLRGA